ncbi:hypothetical protein [Bacteriovorax stolpii]|uniref:hypothetical protein n=1 Tax=Bacteriovorax stolpii TaxID=960 RepID=UPI00115B0F29|nr:hypothetical protein [Bacteriovorax stolpii]
MKEEFCCHDKLKKAVPCWIRCGFFVTKFFWSVLAGIPTLLALVELFVFGISKNSFLLKPVLLPRTECRVIGETYPEGTGKNFNLEVTLKKPVYVGIMPISSSMEYKLSLSAFDSYSFFSAEFPTNEFRGRIKRYSEQVGSISKTIETLHKFRTKSPVKFTVRMSGPYEPEEKACPFDISVKY